MPRISVIIPTYNRERLLPRALRSVINQSTTPAEVIVVDDGSSDNTRQVIKEIAAWADLELRYLRQSNRGPAAARNLGIRAASGEYLAFLDSDDEFHRDKLAIQYARLCSQANCRISHTRETWLRRGSHLNQKKIHAPPDGDIFLQCLRLCCVGMSTVMMHRGVFDTYGYFDETLRCCEDYDFWLRLAPFECFCLVQQQLTVKHGGRPDQVSNAFRTGMDRFRIQSLARLLSSGVLKRQQYQLALEELQRKCSIYADGCIKHQRPLEAAHYQRLAAQFDKVETSRLKIAAKE